VKAAASAHLKSERSEHTIQAVTLNREGTMEQLRVREVMRPPPGGGTITFAQAKRAWLEVMREEREAKERKSAERRARRRVERAPEAEP
jgi:hypothetical protein